MSFSKRSRKEQVGSSLYLIRYLALTYLLYYPDGHDSVQDSVTALELLYWRIVQDKANPRNCTSVAAADLNANGSQANPVNMKWTLFDYLDYKLSIQVSLLPRVFNHSNLSLSLVA